MSTLNQIESEIAALPLNLRAEVLDFVQFVKQRHGLPRAPIPLVSADDKEDSPFFQALQDVGFIGCVESDEQLSTTYKSQLNFSTKAGATP
ncbi:MAG: hypothetical protein WA012_11725 [Rhodoferax sp.]|jgi:hypothetical protein|uniref:hypothetical protein n=1 Tax=Rhodoferax sp. TaxID=50421 RepID=UPI003BB1ED58